MTEVTIKQLFDEIVKTRTDITCAIEATEARLLLKIEEDKNRIKYLEKENQLLKDELEAFKRKEKKNNIVIFGVKHQPKTIEVDFIKQKIKELLDVNLETYDISDTYPIGTTEDSPIKIELTTQLKKREIFKKSNKLKGTTIYINHDLTSKQREENKELRKYLQEARQDKRKISYIKNGALYIENKAYTLEELKEQENLEYEETNSAPETPTIKDFVLQPNLKTTRQEKPTTPKEGTTKKQTQKTYETRHRLVK